MSATLSIDKDQKSFWSRLKRGDIVRVSDSQALMINMQEKHKGIKAMDYEIMDCTKAKVLKSNPEVTYFIIRLQDTSNIESWLIAKHITHSPIRLFMCYIPPEIPRYTREDMIADENLRWMFDGPEKENWEPSDLEYSEKPNVPSFIENGKEVKVNFKLQTPGINVCAMSYEGTEIPMMILEYKEEPEKYKNPYMLIFEDSYLDDKGQPIPSGGLMQVLFGCSVDPAEIDVLNL